MVRLSRCALLAGAVVMSSCAVDLGLDSGSAESRGRETSAIVNGQATTEFPTTGILLADPATLVCSGTLIGCDRFLTAAHCVCFFDGPDCQGTQPDEPMHVYLQNGGFFAVTAQHVHPDFSFPDNDVAVLELARPAVGLLPSPLPDAAPGIGEQAVIVGYGRSGGGSEDYGIKQFGPVVTAACTPDAGGPGHVCWDFEGEGANTCNGDSGGPLFVEQGGALAVAGITSGGTRNDCLAGDHSYDNDVFAFRDYIVESAGGAERLGQASCGGLPHVGQDGAVVASQQGLLAPGQAASYEVEVAPGTAELRVSLNSTEGSNPDLYIRAGEAPTVEANDCAADGPSSYGFCEVSSPVPGTWHLMVQAVGSGEFQLTTTALAGAPVAADDSYGADAGVALEVAAAYGVLANDAEAGRGSLVAEIGDEPAHGQVDLRADGGFTYTPAAGYSGDDSFTYRASDGTYSGAAAVALTIAAAPPPEQEDDGGDDATDGAPDPGDEEGGCAAGASSSGPTGWLLILLGLGLVLARRDRPRTR